MRKPLLVAVLMGGTSAEREVSLKTGSCVARELASCYAVKPIEILANGQWRAPEGCLHEGLELQSQSWFSGQGLSAVEAVRALLEEGVDVVFNALHGPFGEDGTVQGFLRVVGLPFTGPDVTTAAVTMDKRLTKHVLMGLGLRTPRCFVIRSADLRKGPMDWQSILQRESSLVPLPWVLKPNRLGSSVGIAILRTHDQVLREAQAVLDAWPANASSDDLLVEEAVTGRELTCGVLETDGQPRALLPIEIRPRSSLFFDYKAKYTPGASEEVCPALLSADEKSRVQDTALLVHQTFRCAPLSRTDMFLTPDGEIEVLEVNTLPGMTETSLIPLATSKEGMTLRDLFSSLVEHAMARVAGDSAPRGFASPSSPSSPR